MCQATPTSCAAGYVAIGFTDNFGEMGPADVYVGFLDKNGTPHVVDSWTGEGHSPQAPDTQQDAIPISGSLANGVLTITFLRLLDTKVCVCVCVSCSGQCRHKGVEGERNGRHRVRHHNISFKALQTPPPHLLDRWDWGLGTIP